jgi:uroporphyrinogen-III synthase
MSEQRTYYLLATATVPNGLVREAAKQGFVLDVAPFIRIEYADTDKLFPQVAVFTSLNAVHAVTQWVDGSAASRIYCISGATYAAVVEAFGEKAVVGKAGSAAALATVIGQQEVGQNREIVFFCGDQRREELPSLLRQSGLKMTEKIVYRTVLTPHRMERNYDGIAFFSPSAVESYFSANRVAADVPLFAIGPTTAAAIHSRCANPVIVGERPEKALLIRRMTEYLLHKR